LTNFIRFNFFFLIGLFFVVYRKFFIFKFEFNLLQVLYQVIHVLLGIHFLNSPEEIPSHHDIWISCWNEFSSIFFVFVVVYAIFQITVLAGKLFTQCGTLLSLNRCYIKRLLWCDFLLFLDWSFHCISLIFWYYFHAFLLLDYSLASHLIDIITTFILLIIFIKFFLNLEEDHVVFVFLHFIDLIV